MGFDVYGKRKDSYFRNNVWFWRPLWDYVSVTCDLSKEEAEAGHFNDGYFISKTKANKISKTLFQELKSDRTQTYNLLYKKQLEDLVLETCKHCNGTGIRNDEYVKGHCNVCNTEHSIKEGIPIGKVKSSQCQYPFDVDNVREFAEFCKESDGFEIC